MGWTSWDTKHDKQRHATAADFLAASYTFEREGVRSEVVAHRMVGSVWYGAVRVRGETDPNFRAMHANPDDFTTALVVLTEGQWGGRWGEKGMDECMGPSESRCPIGILNTLTALTDRPFGQYARAWRERCRNGGRRAA